MRNTVVRATMRVNGKPPILGIRSPLTPQSIELKFDTDDYVGGGTPLTKTPLYNIFICKLPLIIIVAP